VLTKSHGLGNDYLVADPTELPFEVTPERVRALCDRHRGVGSDGLLVLSPAAGPAQTFGLRIFNPDGSEAEKSGNGIRIFARWLVSSGRAAGATFTVQTLGGVVPVTVDGNVVTADMGVPRFRDDVHTLDLDGTPLEVVALDVGNPHCVIFVIALDITNLRIIGPLVERHPAFPSRTNVQFAHVVDRGRVELLIWERGAGETQASGSSACAVVAAAHRLGRVNADVTASMPGGELSIRIDDDEHVWMRGPVEQVASVTLSQELIQRLQALP
jgi:diaminopimelate epimerase